MTKPNALKSAITNVSNNLAVDNPKFEDKAIKEALIACARQYALYFDTSGFDKLISTLPNGTWKNRTHDLKEYVKGKKPKWVRENFKLVRDKLNSLSATPGYEKSSASEKPIEPNRN